MNRIRARRGERGRGREANGKEEEERREREGVKEIGDRESVKPRASTVACPPMTVPRYPAPLHIRGYAILELGIFRGVARHLFWGGIKSFGAV